MPIDTRRVILCADDYGIAPGVGRAVRELIELGRLSATSCMTTSQFWPAEARLLAPFANRADVGLHLTLTDQTPLGPLPTLAEGGRLPSIGRLMRRAYAGRLDAGEIAAEIGRQLDAFEESFGGPPAFLDGHHHVHQLPVIGDTVLALYERRLRRHGVYLRYTDESFAAIWRRGLSPLKASVIAATGHTFARRGRAAGIPGNRGFRGVREFVGGPSFAAMFPRFVAAPTNPTIVMCHPGIVDDALAAADPATAPREEEYRYLAGEECGRALAALGVRIGRFSETLP